MIDKLLIDGCIKGDAACQRKLFEHFADKMTTICRRYARDHNEAQDILQDSFIRVFAGLHKYRYEGPLDAWIRRIVIRTAINTIKKNRIRFVDIDVEGGELPSLEPDALTAIATDELLNLISALPDGYRLVFNLYVLEGYDHQEIGAILGISASTSRSQLHQARRTLQTRLESLKLSKRYASK